MGKWRFPFLKQFFSLAPEPPPVFFHAQTGEEVGPYLQLKDVPRVLNEKKEEVFKLMLASKNGRRAKNGEAPLNAEEEKKLKDNIALMIKADQNTFYGRIFLL